MASYVSTPYDSDARPSLLDGGDAGQAKATDAYGGRDRVAFDAIRESARAEDFTAFLGRFPNSALAFLAQSRLEELWQKQAGGQFVARLGISVASLTADVRLRFGIKDAVSGVIVTWVQPDNTGYGPDFQTGDIIVSIDKKEVNNFNQIQENLKISTDTLAIPIVVIRNGKKSSWMIPAY